MYGLLQTIQSPFQFNWAGAGITSGNGLGQYISGSAGSRADHIAPPSTTTTGGVYLNNAGTSAIGNIYNNGRGSYTYLCSGGYSGFPLTTAPPYNDGGLQSAISGLTQNYSLTITDNNTGQKYNFTNFVNWI